MAGVTLAHNGGISNMPTTVPWFLGAPVSKFVAVTTVASYIVVEYLDAHDAFVFDAYKIVMERDVWRLLLCNLTFSTMGELVMGVGVLMSLMIRFEREMGSRKFGTLLVLCNVMATTYVLLISFVINNGGGGGGQKGHGILQYAGPYPWLGFMLFLYTAYTPRLYPRFVGMLGVNFSEKSITYFFALQVVMSHSYSSMIASLCGAVAGFFLCKLPLLHQMEFPNVFYTLCRKMGGSFVDVAPLHLRPNAAIAAAMMDRRGVGGAGGLAAGGAGGGVGGGIRHAPRRMDQSPSPAQQRRHPSPTPVVRVPPDEAAVEQLTSMGFDREAVIRALGQTNNNVQVAADRLLSGV